MKIKFGKNLKNKINLINHGIKFLKMNKNLILIIYLFLHLEQYNIKMKK
jgi:hypothetical protein